MTRRVKAKRYSKAIFEIARERNEPERWQSDLEEIAHLREDAAFISWLESPKVSFSDKTKFLSQRLGKINPLALNLAYLLVSKGKFEMIGEIKNEYQRLVDGYRGIERAELTTAVPLEAEEKAKLEKYLSTLFDKKVVLESKVDSSIIGGFKVKVGDKLIDASTQNSLETLKKELISAD